jgi:hypothetical protein
VAVVGDTATGNSIRGNSIFANAGLGIDLNDNGVTANDLGDGDTGPNGSQNFPEIIGIWDIPVFNFAVTYVEATLKARPSASFVIDFYSSPAPDDSGFGEGAIYLGSYDVTTNSEGVADFGRHFLPTIPVGRFVTATATDALGNTSEFSQAFPVSSATATLTIAATEAVKAEGQSVATPFTFTVTRSGLTTGTTTVKWAVTGSGANPANGADFVGGTLPSGTLTFNVGETSKTLTVLVAGDTMVEPDEGFTVTLSDAVNAEIETATATGTILNDEPTARLTLELLELDAVPGLVVGESFLVLASCVDLTQPIPQTLFAAYADIDFEPESLHVDSIEYSADYLYGRTGNIHQEIGRVADVGATAANYSTHPENPLVFVLHVTALKSGTTTMTSAAGTALLSEIIRYGDERDQRWLTEFSSLTLSISDARIWHNAALPWDVDGSGDVTPLDALLLINFLNSLSIRPSQPLDPPRYYDVNADGQCSPLDVLLVINYLNGNPPLDSEAEGEAFQFDQETFFLDAISAVEQSNAAVSVAAGRTISGEHSSQARAQLARTDTMPLASGSVPVAPWHTCDMCMETGLQEDEDDLQDLLAAETALSPSLDEIDAIFMHQWW